MRYFELFESPIDDMTFSGDWSRNSSYKNSDRKLLMNPKAQEKIKQQWIKTKFPFNIFFVNSPEGNRFTNKGIVDIFWLAENMPKFYKEMDAAGKLDAEKIDLAINIIYTNNKGSPKFPMTGWMIAHRFGHVLQHKHGHNTSNYLYEEMAQIIFRYVKDIFEIYNIPIKNSLRNSISALFSSDNSTNINLMRFFSVIGTMRSARENMLSNSVEFFNELIAQYLLTGKVKFNKMPASFKGYKGQTFFCKNQNDLDYIDRLLDNLADELNDIIEEIISDSVGEIFVM